MGDVNLEIKLHNVKEKTDKIIISGASDGQVLTYDETSGNFVPENGGSGSGYITSVTNDFKVTGGELAFSDEFADTNVELTSDVATLKNNLSSATTNISTLNTKLNKKVFNSYEYAMNGSDVHTDNNFYKKIVTDVGWFGIRLSAFFNPTFYALLYLNKNASGEYTIYGNTKIIDSANIEVIVTTDKKTLYIKTTSNTRFYIETTSNITFENYAPS